MLLRSRGGNRIKVRPMFHLSSKEQYRTSRSDGHVRKRCRTDVQSLTKIRQAGHEAPASLIDLFLNADHVSPVLTKIEP